MSEMMQAEETLNPASTGRWKAYPAYKDSGIEWLGEIPEHWEVRALKYAARFINGAPFKPNDWEEEGISIIRIENLNGSNAFNKTSLVLDSKYVVSKDDLLFAWSGNRGTSFGPYIWNYLGSYYLNQHIFHVNGFSTDQKWFYWQLKGVTTYVESQAHGIIGLVHITKEDLGSIKIPIMTENEQVAIAAFLDCETARIDALVAKKERLVELLREKRAALISHAVTKGLDDGVRMKDSGVEWLGEIPEHWEVRRLKFVADVLNGVAKGRDLGQREVVELPYLRVANVQDGYLDLSDIATITVGVDEIDRYSLQPGDVLMNEGGDFDKLGRGYVWNREISPCLHQNHVFAVRPHSGINPYWISLITLTSYAKHYFILKSKQSTNLASISATNLKELPVLMPPDVECGEILAYIGNITAKIDALITGIREGIEKLQEYRVALIAAAVMGKIDVREGSGSLRG